MSTQDQRYERGQKVLKAITGGTGHAVVEGLKDIAPDLAEWIIAFCYGDVLSRPGLDLRSRQFSTVAALTAMGKILISDKLPKNPSGKILKRELKEQLGK